MFQSDSEFSDTCAKKALLLDKTKVANQYCTDFLAVTISGLPLLIWLTTSCFALTLAVSSYSIHDDGFFQEISNLCIESNFYVWFVLPCVVYFWFYFMAMRFMTKFTINLTIVLTFAFWVALFYISMPSILMGYLFSPFLILISIIIHGAMFYVLITELDYVSKVIQDSCKAMLAMPSFLVIVILQISCMILITLVSYAVMRKIYGIDQNQFIYILTSIYGIISLWLLAVIYNFGQVVLYKTFATWYRTADKTSIPSGTAFICAANHFRYHMGTLAFGSTVFAVFPILLSVFYSWKTILENIRKRSVTLICLPFVLGNAIDNALIVCATQGTNFYCSMKNSFRIILLDPVKFAVTRLVATWMIVFGLSVVSNLTVAGAQIFFFYYNFSMIELSEKLKFISTMLILLPLLITIVLSGFNAAITSILFCSLEDLDYSESYTRTKRINDNIEEPTEQDCP